MLCQWWCWWRVGRDFWWRLVAGGFAGLETVVSEVVPVGEEAFGGSYGVGVFC